MAHSKEAAKEQNRDVRAVMARHSLDFGQVSVTVTHGVAYLYGRVRTLRGYESQYREIREAFLKALRAKTGIREVVEQWQVIE
jgi:osmotically-inducible protein OsmY